MDDSYAIEIDVKDGRLIVRLLRSDAQGAWTVSEDYVPLSELKESN